MLEQGDLAYLKEPYSYFRWHEDNGQRTNDFAPAAAICLGLCIKRAWAGKVFLKTFDDLKPAAPSWFTLTEQLYRGIRKVECDPIKVNDYLTAYRAFSRALGTEGMLEFYIDTSQTFEMRRIK